MRIIYNNYVMVYPHICIKIDKFTIKQMLLICYEYNSVNNFIIKIYKYDDNEIM